MTIVLDILDSWAADGASVVSSQRFAREVSMLLIDASEETQLIDIAEGQLRLLFDDWDVENAGVIEASELRVRLLESQGRLQTLSKQGYMLFAKKLYKVRTSTHCINIIM